ncbi:MAG TPA: hypothetical protein VEQ63_13305, partial [Bryobacteraceae bacterium]|nr:hypothetical protein [Bryobacteraceae bacterium]
MPKVALGLFHFNVQWLAGDTSSYHRYVNESLEPFLRMIERNPAFRVSLEMAGTGLEFLQDSYPDVLRRVRRLIHEERIELISSTFSPSAWIAYPGTDLRRSIEVNRRTLERLGLPISRIFFAQEAFFGDGIRGLGKYFDWAICKDEYLDYYFDIEFTSPVYKLGDIKVLPASNHILNELSKRLCGPEPSRTGPVLGPSHRRHLKLASQECSQIPYRGATGTAGDLEWAWYHCGDGNHATSMFPPHDWERCFQDPWWTQ